MPELYLLKEPSGQGSVHLEIKYAIKINPLATSNITLLYSTLNTGYNAHIYNKVVFNMIVEWITTYLDID